MRDFGLLDSRMPLVIVYTAMGLPSTVFIMTGLIHTLPRDLEDAARADGAREARIMWSVVLPPTRPPIVIAAIHDGAPTWNDVFLPQGLTALMGEHTADGGVLLAGLTSGALK